VTALTFGDRLGDVLRDSGIEYAPPEHHEAGRVLPDDGNAGNTWKCSCGRLFPTQKARSTHQSAANRRV
jgi:hypothetical protein